MINRLKNLLEERKISNRALEQAAGLSNGAIKKWETQKPSYDKVLDVAKTLNISIEWLITGEEPGELSQEAKKLLDNFYACSQTGKDRIIQNSEEMRKLYPEKVSTSKIG